MHFEREDISDWARSHSMAAGSFASQDDRWQNTNTKKKEGATMSNENAWHNQKTTGFLQLNLGFIG